MTDPAYTVRAGSVAVWRDVCLRGTGFPARLVLGTAVEESVRLIDAALENERRGGKPWTSNKAAIEAAFKIDSLRTSAHLRDVVRSPLFREAVLWQNRGALHGAMESLLKRPEGAVDSKTREYERLVASYLQRYCVKNDTIGFFGPVGWCTLDAELATSRAVPGPSLLDRRTVYFEHWAIDALAARLSEPIELRALLAPRRMPTIRLEGDQLHYPIDKVTTVEPLTARLIEACDGTRPAHEIASLLRADASLEIATVEEVYQLLEELVEAKMILWRLEVPTAGFRPERALRAAIATAEPGPARDAAEGALTALEAKRDEVANAVGDPLALDAAMDALETTFVQLSGVEASRGAGQVYAGRKIFFEDCRRDYSLVLGRSFLDRIAPQLAMLQLSARWFSYNVASRFREVFAQVHGELAAATGSPEVDFIRFYTALRPHLTSGEMSPTVRGVRDDLQRRWAELLALPAGARHVELSAADLVKRAESVFAAPEPGWPSARHNSPDLLIGAAGPEALARGELVVVLGEVHAGLNSVTLPTLAKEHSDPARLHSARQADVGRSISLVEPRSSVRRASTYWFADGDLDVEYGDARSHRPRSDVFDVAGFVVVPLDGKLCVRRRDGSAQFDLLAFLEGDLNAESYTYDIFPPSSHRPRVTIDQFVLARERWRFATSELAFAKVAQPLDRFVAVRKWAQDHGIPRFLFVKAPDEPKPMYCDLDSPVYVEILCKLVRSGDSITLSEMLPSFEHFWLTDSDGETYCSELRMSLVDDAVWTGTYIDRT